jgi:hypothetical protein
MPQKFDPKSIKLDGIHVMKNSDKTWHESWSKPRGRSMAAFPHPFTLCLLGVKNRGKTNTIVNVFLQHQTTTDPFKQLIVIGPSNGASEYSEMEPTFILTDIPPLESFADKKIKKLLVFDDFDLSKLNATQKRNLSQLVRCNTHIGLSICISYQSFFDVPTIIRNTTTQFILWKSHNKTEASGIAKKVGLNKAQLHYLLEHYLTGHYDNLCIDLSKDTPAFLRKNLLEKLDVPEID